MTQKYITQTLITYPEFLKIVKSNEETYKKLLPLNKNITDFLKTRFTEVKLKISQGNYKQFMDFVNDIHNNLRPGAEHKLYDCPTPFQVYSSSGMGA